MCKCPGLRREVFRSEHSVFGILQWFKRAEANGERQDEVLVI